MDTVFWFFQVGQGLTLLEVANQQSYHMKACQTSLVVSENSASWHLVLAFFLERIFQKFLSLDCCQNSAEIELYPALLGINHFNGTNVLLDFFGESWNEIILRQSRSAKKRAFFVVFFLVFTETVKKRFWLLWKGYLAVSRACTARWIFAGCFHRFPHFETFGFLGRRFFGILGEAVSFPKLKSAILNNTKTGSRVLK